MEQLVSIITPAYNCIDTFLDTYNSVLSQTYKSWEWIIVDDCSNDGSFDYIKRITKNDDRIILISTNKNGGAAFARNVAIEKSKGRFIAFLDADDMWHKDKLQKQILFMEQKECAFSFTDYETINNKKKKKNRRCSKSIISYRDLIKCNYIGCLTVVYDTQLIGKNYMPLDCIMREDHGAWLDITKKGIVAYKFPEILSTYRLSNGSVSSKKGKMFKKQYNLYRNHEKFGRLKSLFLTFLCSCHKLFR